MSCDVGTPNSYGGGSGSSGSSGGSPGWYSSGNQNPRVSLLVMLVSTILSMLGILCHWKFVVSNEAL